MKNEKQLRSEIFKNVKALFKLQSGRIKFVPGSTPVNYAGRVYDEKEMINLVDSSLEFWLTAGRYAREFEEKFARFLGVTSCLLVNSGSSANLLAVSALTSPLLKERRLKPGDEIITTACGFPTTLNPILQNNLVPVFIDVELGSYNIDASKIEKALSKKTKAIFVAHTLGNPANIAAILKIAKKHRLWFIEDNCDALGSKYNGRYTGTFGDLATASFYPPHHMTMGEGGAVMTSDPLLKRIVLSLRDWGRDCWCEPGHDNSCNNRFTRQFGGLPYGYDHKYVYSHVGYNLKVTDMQAAVGVAQLDKLNGFISMRRKNFDMLFKNLQQYDQFILPSWEGMSDPSWFGFPILVKNDASFSRSEIVQFLESHKIATRMLFGGNLTKQPAYENMVSRMPEELKNTDTVMNSLFWIGVYPGLDHEKMDYVISVFRKFMNGRK